jgi:hypothetical protein
VRECECVALQKDRSARFGVHQSRVLATTCSPPSMRSLVVVLLAVLTVLSVLVGAALEYNPEEYVNILGGTASDYGLSHGGTLPLLARPWVRQS